MNATLFNCILNIAFAEWRASLRDNGIFIAHGLVRLTNTRYADDVLLYLKPLEELESMMERFVISLQRIGLTLNTKKTKLLRSNHLMEDSNLEMTS